MDTPKVSVIMPVYNVERYLRICIESALAQTLKEIEIIILDDGSTDSSPQIIDYYARCDSRVRAVHKENEGYGKSCNRGFDLARGEYVAILESDDFIDPEMYERLYTYAKELDADVVKGPYRDFFSADGTAKPYPFNDYLTECMPKGKLYSLIDCPCQLATHQSIWAGIYRRDYLNEHGIRFAEVPGAGNVDVGFCVDSLLYSDRIAWLDEMFYNYRVLREGSSTANYNIPVNLSRYQGVHKVLSEHPDIRASVAPQLVAREGVGLLRYFKFAKYTEEDLKGVQELFSFFSDSDIARAPIIDEQMRDEIYLLRRDLPAYAAFLENRRREMLGQGASVGLVGSIRLLVRELDLEGIFRLTVLLLLNALLACFAMPPGIARTLLVGALWIASLIGGLLLVILPYKRSKTRVL